MSIKKKFGLIGGKLSHSFSPMIHSVFGDYEYKLYPLEESELEPFFRKKDFDGLNVTIPYKQTVISYCSSLSPVALRLQSVNTIKVMPDGTLFGDNTDYFGFSYMLRKAGISCNHKKVLVLGSGGSSKTVQAVCKDEGASDVVVVSRSGKNNYDNLYLHKDTNIIINTTPVGMFPNNTNMPVIPCDFPVLTAVCDLIYNPLKTPLLLEAEKLGINYVNGLHMLAAQGYASSMIFTDSVLDSSVIEEAVLCVRKNITNIVLIGMPGCGKSSVGKLLAKEMQKDFLDTDDLISQEYGSHPSRIISEKGEPFFRDIEKNVIKDISKFTGAVIATGGGAVLNETNMDFLRQNGIIIFIDRPVDKLAVEGRPLSKNIDQLYNTRYPIYKKYADFIIDGSDSIYNVARDIIKKII